MTSDLPRASDKACCSSGCHWSSVLAVFIAIAALFFALKDHYRAPQEPLSDEQESVQWQNVPVVVIEKGTTEEESEGLSLTGYASVTTDDLLRWNDLRGFRIRLATSGRQAALGSRFAFYQRGELLSATKWHWDFSEMGQQKTQELSLLFHIDEEAGVVNIWRRLYGAAGKLQLTLPVGFKAQLFPESPRMLNQHQIPLAVTLAPDETWAINSDFDPESSYLILVMELMEYDQPPAEENE